MNSSHLDFLFCWGFCQGGPEESAEKVTEIRVEETVVGNNKTRSGGGLGSIQNLKKHTKGARKL